MGVTPGRLPGATVSQDKTSGVRRSVEVELVGYLLLCHEQGMRKGQGLGEDRGAEKAATKWLRSTTLFATPPFSYKTAPSDFSEGLGY